MLSLDIFRNDPQMVKEALKNRCETDLVDRVDEVVQLDVERRSLSVRGDKIREERNELSSQIKFIKDKDEKMAKINRVKTIKTEMAEIDERLREVNQQLNDLLYAIPNIPDPETPIGSSEDDNVVIKTIGEQRKFDFQPKPHWDLGTDSGLIDFTRGVKLSGPRFYVLKKQLARLQRGLIAYLLDFHLERGYDELYLPLMVRQKALFAAGQLPKFESNLYHDIEEDYWMVPTAEVPITYMHGDEILDQESFPIYYTAYTACFRREKTSAGRDVRGIKRGHQFDKVELYKIVNPEESDQELEKMVEDITALCASLGLPYRIKLLCTADISFASRKTYDIEMWAPGCEEWLEVSSASNCGDYQSRRSAMRYKEEGNKRPQYPHTLNGSALGIPRTMIAIMENYQLEDGSIAVPEVLQKYVGAEVISPT